MLIYNGKKKKIEYNGQEFDFYCGPTLDKYSSIFARIACGDLNAQEAYDLFVMTHCDELKEEQ